MNGFIISLVLPEAISDKYIPRMIPRNEEIIVAGIAVNNVPNIKGMMEYRGSSDVGYHSTLLKNSVIPMVLSALIASLNKKIKIRSKKRTEIIPFKKKKYFTVFSISVERKVRFFA
jgi:hypothetical protein